MDALSELSFVMFFFCAMFDAFFILLWVGASSNDAPLLFCFLCVAL